MDEERELTQNNDQPKATITTDEDEAASPDPAVPEAIEFPTEEIPSIAGDELDVSAALAAIGQLEVIAAAPDEPEEPEAEDETEAAPSLPVLEDAGEPLARPPLMTIQRGQLASTVPAIVFIVVGAWLTLTLTTSGGALDSTLLVLTGIGAFGVILLAQWLSSARWARGSFFVGSVVILTGITAAYLIQPDGLELSNGWPLTIVTMGVAFILTAVFTQPASSRLTLIGLMVCVAGITGLALTTGTLSATLAETLANLWPIVAAISALVLLLPIIRRRREP